MRLTSAVSQAEEIGLARVESALGDPPRAASPRDRALAAPKMRLTIVRAIAGQSFCPRVPFATNLH